MHYVTSVFCRRVETLEQGLTFGEQNCKCIENCFNSHRELRSDWVPFHMLGSSWQFLIEKIGQAFDI